MSLEIQKVDEITLSGIDHSREGVKKGGKTLRPKRVCLAFFREINFFLVELENFKQNLKNVEIYLLK